jgi:predicted lipid-binding transport protein (Tim44 family)
MKIKSVVPVLFAVVLSFTVGMHDADAKRLGGGGSIGRQSSSIGKSPTTPSQAPAQSAAQKPATPAPAPAPAPASGASRWLGPIAGLAAGLGIAALLSHMGMGGALAETMGSMLLIGGLIFLALMAWRMFRNRGATPASQEPAFAGAGSAGGPQARMMDAPPASAGPNATGVPVDAAPAGPSWTIPTELDVGAFTHASKVLFLRLQAASDAGNLADIREFTTPEMYAEVQLELSSRGGEHNQTEVFRLEAQLLGVEEQNGQSLASVRFSGTIRETAGADAQRFSEIWNFTRPTGSQSQWLLAGIQQN